MEQVSQQLRSLDNVSRYKFGVLNIAHDSTYLKMEGELYLLTTRDAFDLVTVQPTKETVIFDLEDFELVMEREKIYFLKPAPESALNLLDKCIIKKYISVEKMARDNVSFSDELDFARQRIIDLLRIEIGKKRLKMTCWPFENVRLDTFLDECNIPHSIVLKYNDDYRFFEEDVSVETNADYYYSDFRDYFKKEFYNDKNEAYLFENSSDKTFLLKKIENLYWPFVYNGSKLTLGSLVVKTEHEEAFVIFNPDSAPCGEQVVLPLESPDNRSIPFRSFLLNSHMYQTTF
jgi:hypothetical protein